MAIYIRLFQHTSNRSFWKYFKWICTNYCWCNVLYLKEFCALCVFMKILMK